MVEDPVPLHLPDNVVKGSARASISISGDLMGLVLQNLDRLVQLPHGCGEQNMVLFAPIVYVLQYLEKTRQMTPEIKERATGLLHNGYQAQLLYKHRDGSYSVFGQQDGEGNTWGFGKTFQVTRQKRLLVQQAELTEIPGQFMVQAQGSSCVFAQTVLRYHKSPPRTTVTFTLRVNTELANCSQANTRALVVRILVR
ncbi:Alpha-2-macroglobulin-like protein 1 [Aix galericulata]|nr:Alpha-2-macroglobulin-like protein 1 [Aix galericulata]